MLNHPIIQDLIKSENLTEKQATGALGLVLEQLKKHLPGSQFQLIANLIPDVQNLIAQAPDTSSGFLGGFANALGGEKGQILMTLSKGLGKLDIPLNQQKSIAQTLKASVEKHYPDLASLINLG